MTSELERPHFLFFLFLFTPRAQWMHKRAWDSGSLKTRIRDNSTRCEYAIQAFVTENPLVGIHPLRIQLGLGDFPSGYPLLNDTRARSCSD
jgi:hypothetical protein